MTRDQLLAEIQQLFQNHNVEQPQFEARQLMEGLSQKSTECSAVDLSEAILKKAREWAQKRTEGYPLAYLSGKKGFYKYDFIVEPGVLVPRPETEFVLEVALVRLKKPPFTKDLRSTSWKIADLGSGSGCLGLSLAAELARSQLWSIDSSPIANQVTAKNANHLGISVRTEIVAGTLPNWEAPTRFDLIIANPPYIARGDQSVQKSVHDYEPHAALYSGEQGDEALREWSAWAFANLNNPGLFVTEFGAGQTKLVQDILKKAGFQTIEIQKDLSGFERVASALRTK